MYSSKVVKNIVSFLSPLGIVFVLRLMQGESLVMAIIGTLRFFVIVFPIVFVFGWIILRLITGSWKLPKVKPISAEDGIKAEKSLLKFSAKLIAYALIFSIISLSLVSFILGKLYYGSWELKYLLLQGLTN